MFAYIGMIYVVVLTTFIITLRVLKRVPKWMLTLEAIASFPFGVVFLDNKVTDYKETWKECQPDHPKGSALPHACFLAGLFCYGFPLACSIVIIYLIGLGLLYAFGFVMTFVFDLVANLIDNGQRQVKLNAPRIRSVATRVWNFISPQLK